jgi:hypothetical protein
MLEIEEIFKNKQMKQIIIKDIAIMLWKISNKFSDYERGVEKRFVHRVTMLGSLFCMDIKYFFHDLKGEEEFEYYCKKGSLSLELIKNIMQLSKSQKIVMNSILTELNRASSSIN